WFLFVRRFVTGVVAAYVVTSLTFGGSSYAKTVFYGLTASWGIFLWSGQRLPPSRRLYTLELIAWNVALTLVLAEVALRSYGVLSGRSLLLDDTLDAYRLVPGRDYGGGLRGNRLGYPGGDFERDKRPGIFRIAALGDSFAIGPAVLFADNYLTRLESTLPDVEGYNFGVSGAGPGEYLAILQTELWGF